MFPNDTMYKSATPMKLPSSTSAGPIKYTLTFLVIHIYSGYFNFAFKNKFGGAAKPDIVKMLIINFIKFYC